MNHCEDCGRRMLTADLLCEACAQKAWDDTADAEPYPEWKIKEFVAEVMRRDANQMLRDATKPKGSG